MSRRRQLSVADHVSGVLGGDRSVLARTITLVESTHPDHRRKAQEVLEALLPHTGNSLRVGISGVPGVGKSSFIEALGTRLLARGHRLAVLAVDPSSTVTGGSILGDKTRMQRLATEPAAYVRPSPTAGSLGGVHRKTRETLLVCEAAGFDLVFVETVGVGQSEVAVAGLVDTFLLLLLAGAGDELQGIKKGILEVADVLAIHKADGDNELPAQRAASQLRGALALLRHGEPWAPPVLTASSVTGEGLDEVWERVEAHADDQRQRGAFDERRSRQRLAWMWAVLEDELERRVHAAPGVVARLPSLREAVLAGERSPTAAALELLEAAAPHLAGR